jgi:hypothetical protein
VPTDLLQALPSSSSASETGRKYWPGLATFIAAVGAVGGSVLYLVGSTVSHTYFRQWGLDAAMFPSSSDKTIILGYHALINELATAYVRVFGQYALWLVGYALVIWLAAVAGGRWERSRIQKRVETLLQRNKAPFKIGAMLLMSLGLVVVMPLAAFVTLVFLLAWPLSAADAYGKQLVAGQLTEFKLGCDNATLAVKCITVGRGSEVVSRGFLVGSSERVVAVFDPAAERTVLLEREGLVLTGAPRGAGVPESIKGK